jgi:hypothetical protein
MTDLGFTGTRDGLTVHQQGTLFELLTSLPRPPRIHHGNCVGADEQFAFLCRLAWDSPDPEEHSYPCNIAGLQSYDTTPDVIYPVAPPLVRNRHIVSACTLLLACPKGPEEQRSGTWSTIRCGRRLGRPIYIVWPDGNIYGENCDGLTAAGS